MPSTEINFDPKDSVIVVESVLVNKTAKFHSKLVLDTGATYTMISWEMADKLGLSPEKATETITFFSASGEVKTRRAEEGHRNRHKSRGQMKYVQYKPPTCIGKNISRREKSNE